MSSSWATDLRRINFFFLDWGGMKDFVCFVCLFRKKVVMQKSKIIRVDQRVDHKVHKTIHHVESNTH